jgi:hypothetical protein
MKSRTIELVGFYHPEDISKGGNVTAIQKQYLPTSNELTMLMNLGYLEEKYKIILVDKDDDESLYQEDYNFFNQSELSLALKGHIPKK